MEWFSHFTRFVLQSWTVFLVVCYLLLEDIRQWQLWLWCRRSRLVSGRSSGMLRSASSSSSLTLALTSGVTASRCGRRPPTERNRTGWECVIIQT